MNDYFSPKDVKERYETYRRNNIVGHEKAIEAVNYGFRYIEQGISCAIITPDMHGVQTVMAAASTHPSLKNLIMKKKRDDGFIFENDIQFRVIPRINEKLITMMLGKDAKRFDVMEGDPDMNSLKDIMGWT